MKRLAKPLPAVLGLLPALAAIAAGLVVCLGPFATMERARNLLFDEYQRLWPRAWSPDLPVRVLDVDDESLAAYGQWPWPRARLAEIATRLADQGAAAVAFDMLLSEEERAAPETVLESLPASPEREALVAALRAQGLLGRDPLRAALERGGAALAFVLRPEPGQPPPVKAGFATLGDDPRLFLPLFPSATSPLPALARAAPGLGAINFLPDRDLVVRKAPLVFAVGQKRASAELAPSLDVEALRLAQGATTVEIKSSNASGEESFGVQSGVVAVRIGQFVAATDRDGALRIRYAGSRKERRISAQRLLAGENLRGEFEGRIVIVGASAAALADLRSTPLEGAAPGVEIHAEILEHIVSGARLARPDYAPGLEAALLAAGGLALATLARALPPAVAAFGALGALALLAGGSVAAFLKADLLIDPLAPGATWLAAFAAATTVRFRTVERERRTVREAFSRYLSPAVVARLAADPRRIRLGGEARPTTVLFCDARDFTARSEKLSAEEVVAFLNALLTPLTDCVLAEGGTVDKYLGDGLMAFWNAPLDQKDHAARACRAALAMQAAIPELAARVAAADEAAGRPAIPLRIGIGINTGAGFVGNMGSAQRFDYSMVGDAVNTAARFEAATKTFDVPIIVSDETRRQADGFLFVDLGPAELKGKADRAHVYALHGGPQDATEKFADFLPLHDAAMAAARAQTPDARQKLVTAAAHPEGALYAVLYRRLQDALG